MVCPIPQGNHSYDNNINWLIELKVYVPLETK